MAQEQNQEPAPEQEQISIAIQVDHTSTREYLYELHDAIGQVQILVFERGKLDLEAYEVEPLRILTDLQLRIAKQLFER
jgi:hypothetical protein